MECMEPILSGNIAVIDKSLISHKILPDNDNLPNLLFTII